MLTYFYVRSALGQDIQSYFAKFPSFRGWGFIPPIAGLFMGALPSRHHDCGFKVSCTSFLYTSTLKPLPAYLLSKAIADLFMGARGILSHPLLISLWVLVALKKTVFVAVFFLFFYSYFTIVSSGLLRILQRRV